METKKRRGVFLIFAVLFFIFSCSVFAFDETNVSNHAPVLLRPIKNQEWGVFASNFNAFRLDDYFMDPDNDKLSYSVSGDKDIVVFIGNDSRVSFIQLKGWYGTEEIRFTASDGIDKTKSNIIKLTVGESTSEECPGPCCGIDCPISEKICDEGSIVYCNQKCVDGKCIPCNPSCGEVHEPPEVNYPVLDSGNVFDFIPCVNFSKTEKTETVLIRDPSVFKNMVPEGYFMINDPFNMNCEDESAYLNLAIPSNYYDVKILKCSGDSCYPKALQNISEIRCGEKTERYVTFKVYPQQDFEEVPVRNITPTITCPGSIQYGKTKVSFYCDGNVNFLIYDSKIKGDNLRLKPVGKAFGLEIKSKEKIDLEVEMPYSKEIDESTGIYISSGGRWSYLGGDIDKEDNVVRVYVENITSYLDNNKVGFALMEIAGQFNSSFEKLYEPITEASEAVVLIHGLDSTPSTFKEILRDVRMTKQPYDVWALDYGLESVDSVSKELADYMQMYLQGYEGVHMVAHSLGGLIAQQALYKAHSANIAGEGDYGFLDNVKKVLLLGAPNEGSAVVDLYDEMFNYLLNKYPDFMLFSVNSVVVKELSEGLITPRVPNINYYVIAGNRPYGFVKAASKVSGDLFNGENNDGIVSVKSAQHIGDSYLNKLCENYWEVNLSHMELIHNEPALGIVESIISSDKKEGSALLGNTKYFEMSVEDCSSSDTYLAIGKKRDFLPSHKKFCGLNAGFRGSKLGKIIFYLAVIIVVVFLVLFLHKKKGKLWEKGRGDILDIINKNFEVNSEEGYKKEDVVRAFVRDGYDEEAVNKCLDLIEKEFMDGSEFEEEGKLEEDKFEEEGKFESEGRAGEIRFRIKKEKPKTGKYFSY